MIEVSVDAKELAERLKAELGNLVYQLAVKEAIIKNLLEQLDAKNIKPPAN